MQMQRSLTDSDKDGPMANGGRGWSYWSRNKLEILAGYLPAFNSASSSSEERIYLDLMAGAPHNFDRHTGERFDGSARIAMDARPGFTRYAFGEMPKNAALLQADLDARHPAGPFEIYPGDCNITIHKMLADLANVRWAPTFAFLDQQAAELDWETLEAISQFRRGKTKAEQWILCSPAMVVKGATGTSNAAFAARVDRFYGSRDWRRIQRARVQERISPSRYRAEMVNLLRWRLETKLGYKHTARIPMRMLNGVDIYDMVFATDHDVGLKIMTHLYEQATAREPRMRQEALEATRQPEVWVTDALFDMDPVERPVPKWRSTPTWDPASQSWWT
jgi:three-Cys-motif partner protein